MFITKNTLKISLFSYNKQLESNEKSNVHYNMSYKIFHIFLNIYSQYLL